MTADDLDVDVELMTCLLWQHDNAARLQTLLARKQAWYRENMTEFWRSWYRDVFDLTTANRFGLSVWARILGVRTDVFLDTSSGPRFGFGASHRNFGRGSFGRGVAGWVSMTDEQIRLILRARYLALVSRGTAPEINRILLLLVGDRGPAWVIDNGDMTITVFCQFPEDSELALVLANFPIIPVPAGVGVNYQFVPRDGFGFGVAHENFENGGFVA